VSRNDFTIADKTKRQREVDLVRNWIEVAAKMGGTRPPDFCRRSKNGRIHKGTGNGLDVNDIQTCVEVGKQHGVIIGLQNHNDFIQTADEINHLVEAIHSEWLGIILDTGSYRVHNPYDEIAKSIKHTVNWADKRKAFCEMELKWKPTWLD